MGVMGRELDRPPYRAMGPVTEEEYLYREEYYDSQVKEHTGLDPSKATRSEKIKALREYREKYYEQLMDAVYEKRGWDKNGVPKLETLKRLGIDYPEVVKILESVSVTLPIPTDVQDRAM